MTLPLTPVADVVYNLPPVSSTRRGFDLGLIVASTDVITPEERVVVYADLDEMIDAGFSDTDPAYLAAAAYFAATSTPSQVAIGLQASGETPLQAIQACRTANTEWYIVVALNADNDDHLEIAAYIESLDAPYSAYFLQTDDSAVLNNSEGNLFATLKDAEYERTLGMYSTDENAISAIMGYPMGATSDSPQSAYTLKFKSLPGINTDDLTTQQVNNIEGNYGNVYVNRGSDYNIFENGNVFSGAWFDEIIFLDKLANEIQLNVMDLLTQTDKVPQTNEGMASLRTVIAQACDKLVSIGFIAPGKWTGSNILTLKTNDYLPDGYLILSESLADQSQSDRNARIAPTIYVAVKLAGAIQSVVIRVNVNR